MLASHQFPGGFYRWGFKETRKITMNKTQTDEEMFYPILIVFALMLVGALSSRRRAVQYDEEIWRQMKSKFNMLRHKIEYCSTLTELSFIEDEVLDDFFRVYRSEPRVRNYTGDLFATIENRKVVLQNHKKNRRIFS